MTSADWQPRTGLSSSNLQLRMRAREAVRFQALAVLAIGVAITGLLRPTLIPMCFAPQEAGKVTVVSRLPI